MTGVGRLVAAALAAMVAIGLLAGCGGSSPGSAGTLASGSGTGGGGAAASALSLPDLELPGLASAAAVRLSDLRGPAVLNVWASWCPPCRAELPALGEVAEQAAGEVEFLGINVLDDPAAAAEAVAAYDVPYPSVVDAEGDTRAGLRWTGPPMTYLVDAQGRVVHVKVGVLADADELRDLVATHLGVEVG